MKDQVFQSAQLAVISLQETADESSALSGRGYLLKHACWIVCLKCMGLQRWNCLVSLNQSQSENKAEMMISRLIYIICCHETLMRLRAKYNVLYVQSCLGLKTLRDYHGMTGWFRLGGISGGLQSTSWPKAGPALGSDQAAQGLE